ncbi:MAG: M23 family metallopeptidase [Bacteroidales bacterium]|nr:M23 family metallopeptidase [Bacteroidales bacterium]
MPCQIKSIRVFTLILLLFSSLSVMAQNNYPVDYFRSPVDFRILLSGTFGELRGGHFHSGIDIKTGGTTGKKIYAVADGYVSRIKVSANGFGKTLYLTHPNAYVSVYAHLDHFNQAIDDYVKQQHYKYESFELNIFPEKGQFPVTKGEVIAYSGNTGGSNGPHLHFEMRLESTQTPVNPLHFGFYVEDYIRPGINWLKIIPSGPGSMVDGEAGAKIFRVNGWGESHRIDNHDTLHISGPFSLAINTWDKLNDASNKNGVYEISLFADGELVYHHDLEKFDFFETRYINSLIDYGEYVVNSRRYQRTEVDPNNKLSIYRHVKNNGILYFDDSNVHELEYVVKDFMGNVSRLPITIKTSPFTDPPGAPPASGTTFFSITKNNSFTAGNIEIELPGSSLYRDMWFEYDTAAIPDDACSRVYRLHNERTPLHRYFTVKIIPERLPHDKEKLLLARINRDGKYVFEGGKWENGAITASIRSFGDYIILIDSVPPEIHSVNIASGIINPGREIVKLKISDELSGIGSYRATLNGEWLLMEYDAKNDLLFYRIDERLKKGENNFRLIVTDNRGNEAVFSKILVRK